MDERDHAVILAKLAAIEATLLADAEARRERQEAFDKAHMALVERVDGIAEEMTRYKGIVGGVAMAVSMGAAVVGLLIAWWQK